jgi:hypothetical protein
MKKLIFLTSFLFVIVVLSTFASDQKEQSYRGLKFSVAGVERMKAYDGNKAADGKEIVVVKTVIDRSNFNDDFRGNDCKLDRARIFDANDDSYQSNEQQRRVQRQLKDEYGRTYGDAKMPFVWSFEVPAGLKLKTFMFQFSDEHVNTGGQDPDENVTSLSFDISKQ